jgi:YD repeat-containing protein
MRGPSGPGRPGCHPAPPGAAQFPVIRAPADAFARIVAAPEALEGPPRAVRGSGLAVRITTMTSDRNLVPPGGRPAAAATQPPGSPRAFSWDAHKRPSGRHRAAGVAGSFRHLQRSDDSARRHVGGLLAANNFDEFADPVDGSAGQLVACFPPAQRPADLVRPRHKTDISARGGGGVWPGGAAQTGGLAGCGGGHARPPGRERAGRGRCRPW